MNYLKIFNLILEFKTNFNELIIEPSPSNPSLQTNLTEPVLYFLLNCRDNGTAHQG